MIYTRQDHTQFLEEELRAVTEEFKKKLETQATTLLLEKDEMFVAQFITFRGNGEMLLKFPNTRSLPRKGDYLYCFTVPKELRNYRNWGKMTYGDLLTRHNQHSESIVCIWQSPYKDTNGVIDDKFSIVAFRGVDTDFARNIAPWQFVEENDLENSNLPATSPDQLVRKDGIILLLGPNKPPFEYLANLQKIVKNGNSEKINRILDCDFIPQDNFPRLLDSEYDVSGFVVNQLSLNDTMILQGPPGTGKTYMIAQICEKLCKEGKSVLVTALTNRALIEVVEKPALEEMLKQGKIHKTKLSIDEAKEVKDLLDIKIKDVSPKNGELVLSTFYISSMIATEPIQFFGDGKQNMITDYNVLENDVLKHEQGGIEYNFFDYVIVDEASQALLSTIAMSKILGKKTLWVGDTKQLAPIILLNEDRINARKWNLLSDGLLAQTSYAINPFYQLSDSFRLTERATDFTGIFYCNALKSKTETNKQFLYPEMSSEIAQFLNPKGGPALLKTDLPIGEKSPKQAIELTAKIVRELMKISPKLDIAVLTKQIATVKALQKAMSGNQKNLLIETVDRVQGLTTDITIFVIPNTVYYSLEPRLFNVATSRSKRHTIIICDKNILDNMHINNDVKAYLQKLDNEFSFYFQADKNVIEKQKEKVVSTEEPKTERPQTNSKAENQVVPKIIGYVDLSKFEKPRKEIQKDKQNIYIIDTNVFVDYPDIISKIDSRYQIVFSAKVIDELDSLKISLSEEQKKNVQQALKIINRSLDNPNVKIETAELSLLPNDFNKKSPDNFILSVALKYKQENPIMLTSDNGLQIKAKGLGITTISLKDFLRQNLPSNLYSKWLNTKK
jgi:rRNA-processing protein FCF1